MKFSIQSIVAGVALAVGSLAANATIYDISYTTDFVQVHDSYSTANYTLTGQVEGTLQVDGNTVLVTDIINWTINGDTFTSASFAGGGIGTFTQFLADGTYSGAATFTLDGSFFDFSAGNASTSNYIEFATNNPYVQFADFAYYGTGMANHEYGFAHGTSIPMNATWSMTPVSGGGGGPISPVPEPASALLMLAGVPLLMAASRRRRTAQR